MFPTFAVVKRLFKYLSFSTVGVILLMLIFATVLEKYQGTPFASEHLYRSPWMIFLWIFLAITGGTFIILSKTYRRVAILLLHTSFLLILAGAFTTHMFGIQGVIRLRTEAPPTTVFIVSDGNIGRLPFQISLNKFHVEHYPGTFAPMDYISNISITDNGNIVNGTISMNNIFSYEGYRLYQSGYDADMQGTTLRVSYDPYGIAVTYTGYILLLISIIAYFFGKDSRFRKLLRSPLLKRSTAIILFILFSSVTLAEEPKTMSYDAAKEFGNLYIYYNNRICPLQTFAKDFTIKLCGKPVYNGYSAEEILAGWCLFPDEWRKEPIIKIKSKQIADILGIDDGYASYNDFTLPDGNYKLEKALRSSNNSPLRRAAHVAHEKYNLINMVCNGSMLRLYPHRNNNNETPVWYSPIDKQPTEVDVQEWTFIYDCMRNIAKAVSTQQDEMVIAELYRIKEFQRNGAGDACPSETRFNAEKIYNTHNYVRLLAMLCTVIGIVTFIYYCRKIAFMNSNNPLHKPLIAIIALIFCYLTAFIVLRGYVSGHLPLSNGFETMVFMAWSIILLTLFIQRRFAMSVPFGFLLCGLTLMVAMIGESNPQITQLIPVLQSPLLSLHVVVIMISYSLFAFAMMNGVTALALWNIKRDYRQIEYLAVVGKIILYPAVFLITIGIFIGAVWANVSWGRYWGWDPKEVWALITMLVYSLALHDGSLSIFRKPLAFHTFCIVAFITVLITYFGVNFVLGGIHSYA